MNFPALHEQTYQIRTRLCGILTKINEKEDQIDKYGFLEKNQTNIYVYYRVEEASEDIDIRYIRESGTRLCDYEPTQKLFYVYETKDHPLNDKLGNILSIFQNS